MLLELSLALLQNIFFNRFRKKLVPVQGRCGADRLLMICHKGHPFLEIMKEKLKMALIEI